MGKAGQRPRVDKRKYLRLPTRGYILKINLAQTVFYYVTNIPWNTVLESHTLKTFLKQPSNPVVFGSFHKKTSRSHYWGCSNHMSLCNPRLLKMDFYGGPHRLERRWNREYRWEIKIIERQKKKLLQKDAGRLQNRPNNSLSQLAGRILPDVWNRINLYGLHW